MLLLVTKSVTKYFVTYSNVTFSNRIYYQNIIYKKQHILCMINYIGNIFVTKYLIKKKNRLDS